MAPASGFGVDRSVELEQLNDALRRDVVTFDWYHLPVDFGDRHHRILHSDGVRQFGPDLFGVVILEKVDGDPPAHISRAPVNLGRVFSGERSPAGLIRYKSLLIKERTSSPSSLVLVFWKLATTALTFPSSIVTWVFPSKGYSLYTAWHRLLANSYSFGIQVSVSLVA